jgi:hypothetical protein
MTSDSALADKRTRALDRIFGQQTGRTRTAEAAVISAAEALDRLVAALDAGDQLGDDYGEARAQIDTTTLRKRTRARICLQGMVHASAVDQATPMPSRSSFRRAR